MICSLKEKALTSMFKFHNVFQAHGSKGVMSMIANSKVDQLISAGKGK